MNFWAKSLAATALIATTGAITVIKAGTGQSVQAREAQTAQLATTCKMANEAEVAALFDRWNQSLQTGDPEKVVANYAARSILLPTVSNKPRLTPAEKADYFHHFLENQPSGKIDLRMVDIGCNYAIDAGLYTFTFAKTGATVKARYSYSYRWDGSQWLITSHHSSKMPE
ncbi:SgcJ/EcaC family oxidoreductase [Limnothrix redekei LRLZ20PSL1]|uniref:SgcJ/EcaC family oxidoreductase n=2 Tax=Limnothrix TaxID=132605 RepID=A0ABW7C671_9CYAN